MKKSANPESKQGFKELDGALEITTPNYDIHIQYPDPKDKDDLDQEYIVTVFDSRINTSDDDDAFVDCQSFWFWWEVLEYLEEWN